MSCMIRGNLWCSWWCWSSKWRYGLWRCCARRRRSCRLRTPRRRGSRNFWSSGSWCRWWGSRCSWWCPRRRQRPIAFISSIRQPAHKCFAARRSGKRMDSCSPGPVLSALALHRRSTVTRLGLISATVFRGACLGTGMTPFAPFCACARFRPLALLYV